LKLFNIDKFPYKKTGCSSKKHLVYIGIGGNIGDVGRRFQKLFWYFKRDIFVDILQTSQILKNPPFGYLEQPDFLNAVMVLKTNLTPRSLLKYFQKTEKKFGRKREFKNSPRTLDIDIIFYDKITYNKYDLIIPHPKYKERESVLIPLNFIFKRNK
jgi:2-amino-4-hydroxy-6-hydroxymethyldihydropteridine diphosphokinase